MAKKKSENNELSPCVHNWTLSKQIIQPKVKWQGYDLANLQYGNSDREGHFRYPTGAKY